MFDHMKGNIMRVLRQLACVAVLSAFVIVIGNARELTDKQKQKIHPDFQVLIQEDVDGRVLGKNAPEVHDAIIFSTRPDVVRAAGVHVNSAFPAFVTARVSTEDMVRLADLDEVSFLDPGSTNKIAIDVSVPETNARLLHVGQVNNSPYKGQGAIVLVFDTGIDWKHLDFRDPSDTTKSRILAIWDQTLTAGAGESNPTDFNYGVEYTKTQIDNEIDGSPAGFVREKDINGHGTHVMGIAAGNGRAVVGKYIGMAPLADLIVVKGGDGSFSETRMIDALSYAHMKALALGKPIAVNFSIGGQQGPHDGTRPYEQAINSFVGYQGRAVSVSAGNDGDVSIHTEGTIAAGGTATFTINLPTYTVAAGSENDFGFEVWFLTSPAASATIVSPTGISYTRASDQSGESPTTTDGTITLVNALSTLNGHRYVSLRVRDAGAGIPRNGTWTLTVTNQAASSASYDGWLHNRDVGNVSATLIGGNNAKTINMPATSSGAITVGAYGTKWSWPTYTGSQRVFTSADRTNNITTFSAQGPTADGRLKPDITAPGQGIFSALSSTTDTTGQSAWVAPEQKHWLELGTSMSAPHVTGAIALLFGIAPTLTSAQAKTLITATANGDGDPFAVSLPNNTWGYGKLDIAEAAARYFNGAATFSKRTYAYDQGSVNSTFRLTGSLKAAVRFTPDVSGRLSAAHVNVTTPNNRPIIGAGPLKCEVYNDNAGRPGTKLGTTVLAPLQTLSAGTMNYVLMTDAGVKVTAGTDYHMVFSQTNATDTLIVRGDTVTTGTRSSIFDGSSWLGTTGNFRIRAQVIYGSGVTAIEQVSAVPQQYELLQNYPNPFNPSTTFSFALPAKDHVTLRVFNLLGQEVATLLDEDLAPGKHQLRWTAEGLASGTYFYRLQAGGFQETKKMVFVK
jgi:minor extracellular serine protease Vpr